MRTLIVTLFVEGENNNLNALYITLSADRKTVVFGRYLLAVMINIITLLLCLAITTVFLIIQQTFDYNLNAVSGYWNLFAMMPVIIIAQIIELPLYFKRNIHEAGKYAFFPIFFILLSAMLISQYVYLRDGFLDGVTNFFSSSANTFWAIAATLAVLGAGMYVSYRFALRFYKRREF
jgi:ABC-type transport system involved in multi-copper enzyme maturation permease subunit